MYQSLGKIHYGLKSSEQGNIKFRRSLYFVKDIQIGELITPDHIRSIRPGYGAPPKYIDDFIGRKATSALKRGDPVEFASIE